MNFFSFDLRKILLGLFIAAIPLVILTQEQHADEVAWYKLPFTYTAGLLQSTYNNFSTSISKTAQLYINLVGLNKEVAQIKKENQLLRVEISRIDELTSENTRMRDMLNFRHLTQMDMIPAEVIARDLSPDHFSIVINKGIQHGLKKLQAVVSTSGAVGYIFEPRNETSQVLLLTDRLASIDAIVQRTRARGVISGRTKSSCRLRYLERADNVAIGDLIVTSGLQGLFPKGFPIGRVNALKRNEYGISPEAYVEPVVDPSKLEEVFVITNAKDLNFASLLGPSNLGDLGSDVINKNILEPLASQRGVKH